MKLRINKTYLTSTNITTIYYENVSPWFMYNQITKLGF